MRFGTVAASLTCCSTTKPVPTSESVASLVSRCLRAVGATRAFAAPGHGLEALEGLALIPVASEAAAIVLADADGRLSVAPDARPGVALLPGRRVRLSSQPGEETQALSIAVEDLPAAIAGWSLGRVFGAIEIELPGDLLVEAPEGAQPLVLQRSDQLLRLSNGLADFRTMIVVGPGVIREGAAGDVTDFVTRTGAGVMTTMGAVGVVPFDHPSWCGVVGVQVDDPALGGLDACELVIAVGVDDDELGESLPMNAQLLEVEPWHLPFLATDWPTPDAPASRSSLVEACSAVLGDHREATTSPLHPVRAVLDVFDAIDGDVQVYADAGPVGIWFARGVVPIPMWRVVVPARASDGFAIAAAIVSALDGNRSVAITMPGGLIEDELLDLAASLNLGIVVEQWGDDVNSGDPSQHRANLVAAMSDSGLSVTGVAVDLGAAAELVDLAGPVVAWPTHN
jgi:hypothetical protein